MAMNFLRLPYFKKSAAVIFLSLFVFTHSIKALHTHGICLASANMLNKNATAVKTDFSCTICDFQIAKDSDAVISDIQIATPQHSTTVFYSYSLPAYNAFVVNASGTDPPSFA
jgi:hypothetical protein